MVWHIQGNRLAEDSVQIGAVVRWLESTRQRSGKCALLIVIGVWIPPCLGVFINQRKDKTMTHKNDRDGFMIQLMQEIAKFQDYCEKRGIQPLIRLNGCADR